MLKEKLIPNETSKTPEFSEIRQFVLAVLAADTRLTLKKRKQRFDEKRWPGAWREFLQECRRKSCSNTTLREKFGITTKWGISFMHRHLSGKPKPAVFKKRRLAA